MLIRFVFSESLMLGFPGQKNWPIPDRSPTFGQTPPARTYCTMLVVPLKMLHYKAE